MMIYSLLHRLATSQTIVPLGTFAKLFACLFFLNDLAYGHTASIAQESAACAEQLKQVIDDKAKPGFVSKARCPLTYTLAQWFNLQRPGASFSEYVSFLKENPDWPLREKIQLRAEQALEGTESHQQLIDWFSENRPQTAKGLQYYAKALMRSGKTAEAQKIVQQFWINQDLSSEDSRKILADFKGFLKLDTHRQRVERLLMDANVDAVKRMFYLMDPEDQTYINTRISLIQGGGDVDSKIAKLPPAKRDTIGLLYDRVKWNRKREKNDKMLELLVSAPPPPKAYVTHWWKERNLLARRLMDDRRYSDAYKVVKAHHLTEGEDFANAEWLAGWLAFRYLKNPTLGASHFKKLYEGVSSPISLARACYWMARAQLALGNKAEAQAWMTKAKAHPGTYYGQLALKFGSKEAPPLLWKRPSANPQVRQQFNDRELVRAIHLLSAAGAKSEAEPFILKLSKQIKDPVEQVFLIELASQKLGSYSAVLAAKKSQHTVVPLIEAAFPVLSKKYLNRVDQSVNLALVHAIIRQESRFKATAVSPAGAKGLMQVMPKTGAQTAQRAKLPKGDLCDPTINVPLGCAHLKELLGRFNGSLILSIAAYNAGASAVTKWISQYGDPRDPRVDVVDWVENIPFAETRNYVQRVLENYAFYRQNLRS